MTTTTTIAIKLNLPSTRSAPAAHKAAAPGFAPVTLYSAGLSVDNSGSTSARDFVKAVDTARADPTPEHIDVIRRMRSGTIVGTVPPGYLACVAQFMTLKPNSLQTKYSAPAVETLMKHLNQSKLVLPTANLARHTTDLGPRIFYKLVFSESEDGNLVISKAESVRVGNYFEKYSPPIPPPICPATDTAMAAAVASVKLSVKHGVEQVKGCVAPKDFDFDGTFHAVNSLKGGVPVNTPYTNQILNTHVAASSDGFLNGIKLLLSSPFRLKPTEVGVEYIKGMVYHPSTPDYSLEKLVRIVFEMNPAARVGTPILNLDPAQRKLLSDNQNDTPHIGNFRGFILATALQFIHSKAPTSPLGKIAHQLGIAGEPDFSVVLAPKIENRKEWQLGPPWPLEKRKTRPYGIWPAWFNAVSSLFADITANRNDLRLGTGTNYEWGDGSTKFAELLGELRELVVPTAEKGPGSHGWMALMVYGDDQFFVTRDGVFTMDYTQSDGSINRWELEMAADEMFTQVPDEYSTVIGQIKANITETPLLFGSRVYLKMGNSLLSGLLGTTAIDALVFAQRFAAFNYARTKVPCREEPFRGGVVKLLPWHPVWPKEFQDWIGRFGGQLKVSKVIPWEHIFPSRGPGAEFYLSHHFEEVEVDGKPIWAFVPDGAKMIASFVHAHTLQDNNSPVAVMRSIAMAAMFPEHEALYDAARIHYAMCTKMKSFTPLATLMAGQDVSWEAVNAAVFFIDGWCRNGMFPSRQDFLKFKYGKVVEPPAPAAVPAEPQVVAEAAVPAGVELEFVEVPEETFAWGEEEPEVVRPVAVERADSKLTKNVNKHPKFREEVSLSSTIFEEEDAAKEAFEAKEKAKAKLAAYKEAAKTKTKKPKKDKAAKVDPHEAFIDTLIDTTPVAAPVLPQQTFRSNPYVKEDVYTIVTRGDPGRLLTDEQIMQYADALNEWAEAKRFRGIPVPDEPTDWYIRTGAAFIGKYAIWKKRTGDEYRKYPWIQARYHVMKARQAAAEKPKIKEVVPVDQRVAEAIQQWNPAHQVHSSDHPRVKLVEAVLVGAVDPELGRVWQQHAMTSALQHGQNVPVISERHAKVMQNAVKRKLGGAISPRKLHRYRELSSDVREAFEIVYGEDNYQEMVEYADMPS